MLVGRGMNERALLTLGLLAGIASGKPPKEWLSSAHSYARTRQERDPMGSAVVAVLAGAAMFYAAERGKNPKVTSFYDALVYVSTNLSVGYSDILAKTPAGKSIGSGLMTYGPALATRVFDPPNQASADADSRARAEAALAGVSERLDLILDELRKARPGG
jgi:voltage-gated potassium channel